MLTPSDPDFPARVRASFARQQVMATLGATMTRVAAGEVELEMPFRPEFAQQHGYLHAGIVATLIDSACGYAAYSLMPEDAAVLTVEFKVNLLAPAAGERLRAVGKVIRAGRTLTICQGEGWMMKDGKETQIALMQASIMRLEGRTGRQG